MYPIVRIDSADYSHRSEIRPIFKSMLLPNYKVQVHPLTIEKKSEDGLTQ